MIHPAYYYVAGLGVVGGIGMLLGSRHAPRRVLYQRLGKTLSYLIIVTTLVWLFLQHNGWLIGMGVTIVVGGLLELVRLPRNQSAAERNCLAAIVTTKKYIPCYRIAAFIIYFLLATGFIRFLWKVPAGQQLCVLFIVCCFDAFSQIGGQLLGRHALCPAISPNKTVEGAASGLLMALIAAYITAPWGTMGGWWIWGICIAVGSLAGDLMGSHCKRQFDIKDFSNWIPYQGGFLDRFGSLIAAGCVAQLLTMLKV